MATYIIISLPVFCARILDVSIVTLRVIFLMQGNKRLAPAVGFSESLI